MSDSTDTIMFLDDLSLADLSMMTSFNYSFQLLELLEFPVALNGTRIANLSLFFFLWPAAFSVFVAVIKLIGRGVHL